MNKITLFIILLLSFALSSAHAQTMNDDVDTDSDSGILQRIAYINSNELLALLPDKVKASEKINQLNKSYKEELQVMQNDYSKKYSDFMTYQETMAENIRLRRMQELYELEKRINHFMEVAQKDMDDQEKELIYPLREKLKIAIYEVGVEYGFICVYDLANPTIVFVTPDAVDITPLVKNKLKIR